MPGTLNDEILRATGGLTVNDGLRAWWLGKGATAGTLDDLTRQALRLGAVGDTDDSTLSELWILYLNAGGYLIPGATLQDNQRNYWSLQP